MSPTDNILNVYYTWLKENTLVSTLDDYTEITTPFLDSHNDCLQVYLCKTQKGYFLTDVGYTLNNLSLADPAQHTPQTHEHLQTILRHYGITLTLENILTLTCDEKDLAPKLHFFIQALQHLHHTFCDYAHD